MALRNTAVFLVRLLLSCVAMSGAARILEEETTPSKGEEHLPELPTLPKVGLPPFPEVHPPPKPELLKVELLAFPEVHLPPKPELPTFPEVHLPAKPELLPPKPEMPTIPEFHFTEPEAKP
ncbi:hypothetical protein CFC21_028865 [Triticum aestivum]|uniref:Uncharacterized protein n=2 Tax=Triticum aestivum TaxID=4565 RepID=A0A3B6D9Q0_WHEAT|nr:protein PELPK1-like [Triticum aestivum]KAF7014941.1 hypothetical protein CFC21_028865 [Triticum aestivum]